MSAIVYKATPLGAYADLGVNLIRGNGRVESHPKKSQSLVGNSVGRVSAPANFGPMLRSALRLILLALAAE